MATSAAAILCGKHLQELPSEKSKEVLARCSIRFAAIFLPLVIQSLPRKDLIRKNGPIQMTFL